MNLAAQLAKIVPNETERVTILSGWSMEAIEELLAGSRPAPQMSVKAFADDADKFGSN